MEIVRIIATAANALAAVCSILNAVEPAEGKRAKWKIVSQEHMDDAVNMAEKYLEAIEERK